MIRKLQVEPHITEIIRKLQESGYQAYVVGGAIRDLLLSRKPKDYDISTSATPEEVREVFGRKSARIIGKRFRLVHLRHGREIIEISTFRRKPSNNGHHDGKDTLPDLMLMDDNEFGNAEEDAMRRDFTVNAIFFDPVNLQVVDYTKQGVEDVKNGVIRAIGAPEVRFEEDPVRMLRALKLLGQFSFMFEEATEAALVKKMPLIEHTSNSRLSLELEKIMTSSYSGRILRAFHQYGFLRYFMPKLETKWQTSATQYMLALLARKNERVINGDYRISISLTLAAMVLPFIEEEFGTKPGELWKKVNLHVLEDFCADFFKPLAVMRRVTEAAARILALQIMLRSDKADEALINEHGYAHARELMVIQNKVCWHDSSLEEQWPFRSEDRRMRRDSGSAPRMRRGRQGRRRKAEYIPSTQVEE